MAFDLETALGYPVEVRHLDWRTREQVIEECMTRMRQGRGARTPWWKSNLPIVGIAIATLLVAVADQTFGLTGTLVCMAAVLAMTVWMLLDSQRRYHQTLREVMLERGIRPGRCFKCGYDVSHTPADACPECGDALKGPGTKDGPA